MLNEIVKYLVLTLLTILISVLMFTAEIKQDWILFTNGSKIELLVNLEKSMVELLKKLINNYPNLEIALVNGEKLLKNYPELTQRVKYVVVESLFFKKGKLNVDSSEFLSRINLISSIQKLGVIVLSVEYIDNGNPLDRNNAERIKQYISLAKKYNFFYYVARDDLKLNSVNIPRISN